MHDDAAAADYYRDYHNYDNYVASLRNKAVPVRDAGTGVKVIPASR
jgi:hypothetical protein